MMHADPRNLVIIAILLVVAVLLWRNRRKVLDRNLHLLAGLTQGTIEFPLLNLPIRAVVTGQFKLRKVKFTVSLFSKYSDLKVCMEPLGIPESHSFLGLWKPGPTDCTHSSGNKIYYTGPGGLYFGAPPSGRPHLPGSFLKRIDEQDIRHYLDHLVSACEQVERATAEKPAAVRAEQT
jgi:hypothetical protein